jgi:hypothetical protein
MSVVTQLYFQIVEEINYMFRPFSGWTIVRLRLEYRRNPIHIKFDVHVIVHRRHSEGKVRMPSHH